MKRYPPPVMPRIAREVAEEFGLTLDDLVGPTVNKYLTAARREAWSRIYATKRFSTPQIGRFFNRDHSTIVHGLQRHREESAS